jgi:cyclase
MIKRICLLSIIVGLLLGTALGLQNRNAAAPGTINILPVRGNVYMLVGDGANITASVGRDGVLLVDTGTAAMADKLIATYKQLAAAVNVPPVALTTCVGVNCMPGPGAVFGWNGPAINQGTVARGVAKPLRFIISTTPDPDHVGGNDKLRLSGESFTGGNITGTIADSDRGAALLGHENLLNRMTEAEAPFDGQPTETYLKESYKLSAFFNGEGVQVFHPPAAHTDSDTMVWFRYSDVIATGPIFSTVSYPVIDLKRGGSIQGELDALNKVLDIAYAEFRSEGGTMIIPGYGHLSDVGDVAYYRNMVSIIKDRIQDMVKKGMTLEQVKAAKPTLDYDGRWGSNTGPWTTSMFIEAVYQSLKAKK